MKVDLKASNPSLISIFKDSTQTITLDASFLIPPDRSRYAIKSFSFPIFKRIWLEPIFLAFPKLAIHEAVYEELVGISIQDYIQDLLNENPPGIIIHEDSTLTQIELGLRDAIEAKIYPHTKYEPMINNKDDRGEVKSLAYIAVKSLIYFAAYDNNAIQLIEKAEEWSTGLDSIEAIRMYELIYYLFAKGFSDKESLRILYKYQYYLTYREKETNPAWGEFTSKMNDLYVGWI